MRWRQRSEKRFSAFALTQVPQVGALGLTDHLDAVKGEILVKSREGEAGPVDRRLEDLAIVAEIASDQFHPETLVVTFEKVADLDLGGFRDDGRTGHGRGTSGCRQYPASRPAKRTKILARWLDVPAISPRCLLSGQYRGRAPFPQHHDMGADERPGLRPQTRVAVMPQGPLLADDFFGEFGHGRRRLEFGSRKGLFRGLRGVTRRFRKPRTRQCHRCDDREFPLRQNT
jgi:hypothetical protein